MKTISTKDKSFEKIFEKIFSPEGSASSEIVNTVQNIVKKIRKDGDKALKDFTQKFDGHALKTVEVSRQEIRQAYQKTDKTSRRSLEIAAKRIETFHRLQKKTLPVSWRTSQGGCLLGENIRPLQRVGVYVPGGTAAYPSTVLMNTIPARVAGVKEVLMASPWKNGEINPYTLVAADLAGVDRIFKVGGAQAVAALAYGTRSIPAVDKIVGPGNIFVATAKRLVFGQVGIDMIAGPTEIVVIADAYADPEAVAGDLLSQAEHDVLASSVLITPSAAMIEKVKTSLKNQLSQLSRHTILAKAILEHGYSVLTKNLDEAASLSNQLAPEHLSLQVRQAAAFSKKITNAGAIFVGPYSAVAFGDYLAGPNHVLPTSRTARFSSPLGVWDFMKRSSVIEVQKPGFNTLAQHVIQLANLEGLTAHAASVEVRVR